MEIYASTFCDNDTIFGINEYHQHKAASSSQRDTVPGDCQGRGEMGDYYGREVDKRLLYAVRCLGIFVKQHSSATSIIDNGT